MRMKKKNHRQSNIVMLVDSSWFFSSCLVFENRQNLCFINVELQQLQIIAINADFIHIYSDFRDEI